MSAEGARPAAGQLFSGGNSPHAAVVGSSIVSFNEGMSSQDREDIYLSNLYAQLATRSAQKDGLVGNWFDYYKNKLKYLGWDMGRAVVPGLAGNGQMADSIARQMSGAFDERFSRQTSLAFASLKRNTNALDAFESASLQRDTGLFQMIPCSLKSPGKIEIALYHKQFSTRRKVSKFLFWPIEEIVESSQEQMAIITFSTLHYATFRERVTASVVAQTTRHLHELDL